MKLAAMLAIAMICAVLFVPVHAVIPVKDADCNDWNAKTFWFEPWGSSGVHKGIDIFAQSGTAVMSATAGLVLYTGEVAKGGKVVAILGPKWRLHYYAHLDEIAPDTSGWLTQGESIGTVGSTGNAINKPAHLHYSVMSLLPYPWLFSTETQGWKKMFYLDPAAQFSQCVSG